MTDYIFIMRGRHGFKTSIETRFFDDDNDARVHARQRLTATNDFTQVRVTNQWGVELFKVLDDEPTDDDE